jgi:nitrite reductase/ring-hydroxylating ferredoxin subunit
VAAVDAKQQFVLGPVEDFPPDAHPIVEAGGREIGIYHVDGRYYAVQNICPHALAPICRGTIGGTALPTAPGEPFQLGLEGRVLRCVWHGWEFDVVTGEALFGIDKRKVKTFPVAVVEGQLVVTMRPRREDAASRDAAG